MKNKPILLVAGDPNSVFFELFFKALKKKKYKSPLILICNQKILINQMKFFNFKKKIKIFKVREVLKEKLNNKCLNIINIEFKKSNMNKRNELIKNYLKESFEIAFKLIRNGLTNKLINGPINKAFLNKKFSPYCSVATWYLWRSIDNEPIQY